MPRKSDSQETTNALVSKDLEDLKEIVVTGFKGVHDRQDLTNGRIGKAETDIIKLRATVWYERAMAALIALLVGALVKILT